jgi:hypothetical protein
MTKYPTDEELAAAVERITVVMRECIAEFKAAAPALVQGFSDDEWAKLKHDEDRRQVPQQALNADANQRFLESILDLKEIDERRHPRGRWKTLPAKLTKADRREFGVERADEDEPDKVRLLHAFAPLACFRCDHSDAPAARKEIVEIIRAIRHRKPLPRPSDIEGDLPVNCCGRKKGCKSANDKT